MRSSKKQLMKRRIYLLGKGRISPREKAEILAIQKRFGKPEMTDDELKAWARVYLSNK